MVWASSALLCASAGVAAAAAAAEEVALLVKLACAVLELARFLVWWLSCCWCCCCLSRPEVMSDLTAWLCRSCSVLAGRETAAAGATAAVAACRSWLPMGASLAAAALKYSAVLLVDA